MAWITLVAAGFLEVVFAYFLKQSEGFSRLVPSALAIVGVAGSLYLLSLALRDLPLGTAYAVWTGIGTVGTIGLGIVLGEPVTAVKAISVALILGGIVGLRLAA